MAFNRIGIGAVGKERVEKVEELPAVAQPRQVVGDCLTVAQLGQESQPAN